ncbi:MAG: Pr6Pr family membrane protein [Solirubrobacterales bacterium]
MPMPLIRGYRAVLAGLALAAIVYGLVVGLEGPRWSTADYFSYFTELSNLLAAGIFLAGALRPRESRSPAFELLRGAAVLYMLTTGIVYAALLSGAHDSSPWANTVLHQVMPIAVALDWLIDPPRSPLEPRRAALRWMAFPALYIAYTLLRGPLAHWYPYFFVSPHHPGGYLRVAVNCVAIALGQVAMALAIVAVGNARAGLRPTRAEAARATPP